MSTSARPSSRLPPSEPLPPAPSQAAARSYFLAANLRARQSARSGSERPLPPIPGLPASCSGGRDSSSTRARGCPGQDRSDVEDAPALNPRARIVTASFSGTPMRLHRKEAPERPIISMNVNVRRLRSNVDLANNSYERREVIPHSHGAPLHQTWSSRQLYAGIEAGGCLESDRDLDSDNEHGGGAFRSLRDQPNVAVLDRVANQIELRQGHLREASASSTASQHSSIIEVRRAKKALEEEGLEGAPWVSRIFDERSSLRDLCDSADFTFSLSSGDSPKVNATRRVPLGGACMEDTFDAGSDSSKDLPQVPLPVTLPTATRVKATVGLASLAEREAAAEEARRRAVMTERAALQQLQVARELQLRLELELSDVVQRGRDITDAEQAARARWAREQAARRRLDAFERSKLESEERRRRTEVEAMREEGEVRAAEVEEERKLALQVERNAIEEARQRLCSLAQREKKLLEERETRKKEEEAQAERKRKTEEYRYALKEQFRSLVDKVQGKRLDRDQTILLKGWAQVQRGEAMRWQRRYFTLRIGMLSLFKDEAAAEAAPCSPRGHAAHQMSVEKLSIEDGGEEDAFEFCQMPFSCVLRLASEVVQQLGHHSEQMDTMVTFSFDNEARREEFIAALTFVIGERAVAESESAYFARRGGQGGSDSRDSGREGSRDCDISRDHLGSYDH